VLISILYAPLRGLVSLVAPDSMVRQLLAENLVLRQRMVVQTRGKPEVHADALTLPSGRRTL
jgi:hypothetical protein